MSRFILLFSLIFSYANMESQIINSIKISSGISISKIDYQVNVGGNLFKNTLIGISTGFEISYLEHQYWRLNSRIGYIERGGSDKFDLVDINDNKIGEEKVNFLFNYLAFNTTWEFRYKTKMVVPIIFIGPRLDYLVDASNNSQGLKKFNYGFDLGLGLDKTIFEKLVLSIDFIVSHQMNKIAKSPNLNISPKSDYLINLGLEYKL